VANSTDAGILVTVDNVTTSVDAHATSRALIFVPSTAGHDTLSIRWTANPDCGTATGGGFGLRAGHHYRIEVVAEQTACNLGSGPISQTPTWSSAGFTDIG